MGKEKRKYEEAIEKERNVSNGLRDRIGALDEKRKRAQDAIDEGQKRERRLQSDLDALRSARQLELEHAMLDPQVLVPNVTSSTNGTAVAADHTLCDSPSRDVGRRDVQPRYVRSVHRRRHNLNSLARR